MAKKIIGGKMYNTETAKQLAYWNNGYTRSDFNFTEEALYLKKTGEYFLYGHGGAMSSYSESYGTSRCGGEGFTPLTEEGAKHWAEAHLEADEYIAIFGDVEE